MGKALDERMRSAIPLEWRLLLRTSDGLFQQAAYLLKRWQQGCWNGAQLYHEVKEQGYTGSDSYLRRFLADLRKKHQAAGTSAVLTLDAPDTTVTVPADLPLQPPIKPRMSPTRASWLYVCQQAKLERLV